MEAVLLALSTVCLAGGFGYTLHRLAKRHLQPGKTNLVALLATFALLSIDLWMRGREQNSCPLGSLYDVVVFTAWSISLIYVLVGSAYRLSLLGVFTTPLILAILLVAQLAPLDRSNPGPVARDPWIEFHAALSLIAYGAFALGGVAGIMYLLQDRQLKRRLGGQLLFTLPPITDLAIANARLIRWGWALLTVGFAAGFVSGLDVNSLKFWTSAVIWAAYGVLILLRQIHTLAPRRSASLSIAGLGFILATLPVIQHLSAGK